MEDLSKIVEKARVPVHIKTDAYLLDHCFQGDAVFPAVEAMQLLAASTKNYLPQTDLSLIADARFDKFLSTGAAGRSRWIEAWNDIAVHEDGRIRSTLVTRSRSPNAAITRWMEHVTVLFGGRHRKALPLPLDFVSALEGVCVDIPSDRLYGDLVPFGPAFQNAVPPLFVSENGAVGNLQAAAVDGASGPLGSPFPLDAAFHLASVWSQRYSGIVGFPVGFDRRVIYSPTIPGENYVCRIMPRCPHTRPPSFDIWIYDRDGNPKEEILGLRMRDVSGGRITPPKWISKGADARNLEFIQTQCTAFSLIELKTVNGLARGALSDKEVHRFNNMGTKRKISYLAARLCCKSISRQLSGDRNTPASSITTVSPDGIRPFCPAGDKDCGSFCSVSHDSRFAVAIASNVRIGVDVEAISERVIRSRDIYMNTQERRLVEESPLGEIQAAVRVWTAKEAAAKALNMSLAESWEKVSLKDIGRDRSILQIGGRNHQAFHDAIDDHLFTVVNIE
ncbi:MAG: polyketide synthase dehydratase domain-containing protein [Deltaproteobacteria bacterium]|nr:polyketide synthase dehydratase domain-containing protein [Deltaproteobacteria bacterium]